MKRPQRRAFVLLCAVVLLIEGGVGWMTSAGAAEGQLTQIGGNDPSSENCELSLSELANIPSPTAGISGGGFRRSTGMIGIGSDVRGENLYLAASGRIYNRTSVIAGNPRAPEADGPGLETSFPSMIAMAVDPSGKSLWVVQQSPTTMARPPPGRIRRVDLTTPTHPVTTVTETKGPAPMAIAADGRGNLYVTEASGEVYRLDPSGSRTTLGQVTNPTAIAVDVTGTEVFVTSGYNSVPSISGDLNVYRLSGGSKHVVAGSSVPHADNGAAALAGPAGLAIGHETDGQTTLAARYLYIADNAGGRLVRVDLKATPEILTTVAGGGPAQVKSTPDAKSAKVLPKYLAADFLGRVYIAAMDQCAIFELQTPPAFRLPTEVTQPPAGQTNTTQPPDSGQTRDNNDIVQAPAGNSQGETGTVSQPGPSPQTQIVPGSESSATPQPQTELRIIDQGNVVTAAHQAAQPTPQPVQAPGPSAQFTPAPSPTPTPAATPTPTPAGDVSSAVVPDPSPTGAAVAEVAPVAPPAPGPAPASALPPAATEPVANVGLAHGDSAAPSRGATRYAMVRNDEDAAVAGLAVAAGAGLLAIFLCAMFVAPGASSKPKPRPKGAY